MGNLLIRRWGDIRREQRLPWSGWLALDRQGNRRSNIAHSFERLLGCFCAVNSNPPKRAGGVDLGGPERRGQRGRAVVCKGLAQGNEICVGKADLCLNLIEFLNIKKRGCFTAGLLLKNVDRRLQ